RARGPACKPAGLRGDARRPWLGRIYGRAQLDRARNPVHEVIPVMTTIIEGPSPRSSATLVHYGPFRVGIGGPVGSGKTALVEALCKHLREFYDLYVITNDIYTK